MTFGSMVCAWRIGVATAVCSAAFAATASAQVDPGKPYLQSLTYGGSGCPQGSVGQSMSTDRTTATAIFDSFIASSGPGVPVTENRKDCQVSLNVHVPDAPGAFCIAPVVRGYVQVPAGVVAQENTLGYRPNDLTASDVTGASFNGPAAKDYTETGGLTVGYTAGGVVVASLQQEVALAGPVTAAAQVTGDSIDLTITPGPCANDRPYIQSIAYGGTGCPQGTVGTSIATDRQSYTLIFDSYVASMGPGVPITESRKNCQINVSLHQPGVPLNVCLATTARGYVQVPAGMAGSQMMTGIPDGMTEVGIATTNVAGPAAKDYLSTGGLTVTWTGGEPPVTPVNLKTQVGLVGPQSLPAQMTTDSIDGKLTPGSCQTVDTTPPTITAVPSVAPNANGWNNTDVTVTFTCSDDSGVNYAASSLAPVTLSSTGTATGTCVDNAGNSATASYTAKIDKVAPTIAVTSPVSGGLYGLGASVAAAFTCADDNSGVASCSGPATLTTATLGVKTLVVTATDLAGNTASVSVPYAIGGKDQCKGNGFALFLVPLFGNQGQCVSTYAGQK